MSSSANGGNNMDRAVSPQRRVVLITGASSGIGRVCAEYLHGRGYHVYGTSRRAAMPGETDARPVDDTFRLIRMDVDDDASVQRGIDYILEREGRLDVLVNNAGVGLEGAVEEIAIDEAKAEFETNFFGMLRVCRAALPSMRARGDGLIVNMSSMGGRVGIPFQGMYSATKFAMEGTSEAMRLELAPFGVRVVLLEPGKYLTRFVDNSQHAAESEAKDSPYRPYAERMRRLARGQPAAPIEQIPILLERIIESPAPRMRYAPGPLRHRAGIVLKGLLPWRLMEWAFHQYLKRA